MFSKTMLSITVYFDIKGNCNQSTIQIFVDCSMLWSNRIYFSSIDSHKLTWNLKRIINLFYICVYVYFVKIVCKYDDFLIPNPSIILMIHSNGQSERELFLNDPGYFFSTSFVNLYFLSISTFNLVHAFMNISRALDY